MSLFRRRARIPYNGATVKVNRRIHVKEITRSDGVIRPVNRRLRRGVYAVDVDAQRERDVLRRLK